MFTSRQKAFALSLACALLCYSPAAHAEEATATAATAEQNARTSQPKSPAQLGSHNSTLSKRESAEAKAETSSAASVKLPVPNLQEPKEAQKAAKPAEKPPERETGDPADKANIGVVPTAEGNAALEHFDQARFYLSKWQFDMAELELEVAIMYAPNMKIAHRDYSIVSLFRGHPIRAFAEALMTTGMFDPIPLTEAERELLVQRASKIHYARALFYQRQAENSLRANDNEQWDNAIAELHWAQKYTPSKPAIARSLAFCLASKGDFTAAEATYDQCFKLGPEDAFSHADLSFLLSKHGQEARAESQLNKAIELAPRVAALHVDMGWLAERKGDFNKAQQEFEAAIKLCPKQPGLWLQLGKVMERAGKQGDARHAYEEVLSIDSTEDEARQRLQFLSASDGSKPH